MSAVSPDVPSDADPFVAALLERCTFPPSGSAVTCAVSGGPDSTALTALAVAAGLDVEVVHVDHGLRAGSELEAPRVAEIARGWGASFRSVHSPVDAGGDLEARARGARQRALPDGALFGHTADDQAETVLLRILRGTGPSGVAAMRPDGHPLLGLRRAETHALCRHLGVVALRDPTNDDPRFRRNRVRHELLPLMDDIARRDVVPLLARLAALSSEQSDLITGLAAVLDPTDAAALTAAPSPLAAEAIRAWWLERTRSPHPPDAASIRRILDVAAGHVVACDVLGGWEVRRTAGRLRLVDRRPAGAGAATGAVAGAGGTTPGER